MPNGMAAVRAAEQAHLTETLQVIDVERQTAAAEQERAEAELRTARAFDPDALPIREMLYDAAVHAAKNLDLAREKPYFTRVDFTESTGEKQVYYIGKYGVTRNDTLVPEVIDWRAPVANLYYSGQIGPISYRAPDGEISGELTLKRQLGIADGEIRTIFDTDIVSQDAYLQSVLGQMAGDRLREIVTTIQAEQNFVIRHPLKTSLLVQGVAGSGKTTIALHRIAYLLYAFQGKLVPETMMILAPNPLFLDFIAGVLPDLGVEKVRQTTFTRFIAGWLGESMPATDTHDRLAELLAETAEMRARRTHVAQYKGSLAMEQTLEKWLDRYETAFVPEAGMRFGPVRLYSQEELAQFLLVDEKPFPMARRIQELKKQLSARANSAALTIAHWLSDECDRRAETIRATEADPVRQRTRLNALYASRDERIRETKEQVKPTVKALIEALPATEPVDVYRMFMRDAATGGMGAEAKEAAVDTLAELAKSGQFASEDVAAIARIATRLVERKKPDIRHIVIDEAQDFSIAEVRLLRRIMPGATFTIVGDLMQGVNSWRGLPDWQALQEQAFAGRATMHHLVTSYRNTVEIMQLALVVAHHHEVPGQMDARPVLRHGAAPEIAAFAEPARQVELVTEFIRAWQAEGLGSICLIGRTAEELTRMQKALPAEMHTVILDVNEEKYAGGILLAPAAGVKGLEFDGVILLDASAVCFPDDEIHTRLLYVCVTRALHRLAVLYQGTCTPLLHEKD